MNCETIQRKLASILSGDVKEYGRLMAEDEVRTVKRLALCKATMTQLIAQHQGRVVDSPGDNLLAEFGSVVDSVQCAVEIQEKLQVLNRDLPPNGRMEFRIGINLGDVVVEGDHIFGEGVNIAARIEGLADGGGICVSGIVYDLVKNRIPLAYEDLGDRSLKNTAEPVRVYRVKMPDLVLHPQGGREGIPQSGHSGKRVLLVEDDVRIASFISKGLKQAGFVVDRAINGEDGLHSALQGGYDVAVVDIMLPKLDGLTLVENIRKENITTPVIILSAKRSLDDRVTGLQKGGDDYLVKPFSFVELLARMHALMRRSKMTAEPSTLRVGDLVLDVLTRDVSRAGGKIELQPSEFRLLEYLMRNNGRVLSKTMILEHVWDYSFDPQTNVVDVLVCRLRNKVDRDFDSKMIHTVRGVGYVLKIS
jgi:two-component system, OmpR family, response regulator